MARREAAVVLLHATVMLCYFRRAKSLGLTHAETSWEFYGFMPKAIETIHFSKRGHGSGAWFRLRDDRVIDIFARTVESDPCFYEVTMH